MQKMDSKKNSALIAVVSVLATIVVVLIVVCVIMFLNQGATNVSNTQVEQAEQVSQTQQTQPLPANQQPATPAPQANPTTMYVANVANSIYLRSTPYENSNNIITTIPLGAQVVWYNDETPVFSKISYGGMTGYVKRDYLSATKPSTNQGYTAYTSNTTISKYQYVANVKEAIYLRSSMYENSSNIITTIPVGTKVGFIEYANNDFSKINYNGTIGYAKTMYLEDYYYTSSSSSTYMTVCNVKHSIYLRSTPYENSSNIICEIPVNSSVKFISSASNGFYKISWNGYTGYSKSMYLR